jgi:biopolymer transport protein ExbB
MKPNRLLRLLLLLLVLGPIQALAWWDEAWPQRSRIVIDTSAAGTRTAEALSGVPVAIRLHGGNFDFVGAKDDGSDLRVVAADDRTPLPFAVERFDPVAELGVIWVLMPALAPNSADANVIHVYSGNAQAGADASRAPALDAATRAAWRFDTDSGADVAGTRSAAAAIALDTNGLLGRALRLSGTAVSWPAERAAEVAPEAGITVSMWLRADGTPAGTAWRQGVWSVAIEDGRLLGRIGPASLAGPAVTAGTWVHVALAAGGDKVRLFVDGQAVAEADGAAAALAGEMRLGDGFSGAVDQLEVAATARSAAWLAFAAATQGIGATGIGGLLEREGEADAGGGGYMGILVANLTIDAWVVIVVLAVMFVIAAWVMVDKLLLVGRADRDNRSFLERFRGAGPGALLRLADGADHPHAPLYKLYAAGVRELTKRRVGEPNAPPLSGASLDAVKASVDADMVRESNRLNAQMVLLTIAISGGPFLGLLGTVVGVMITFAAIAAAGDVNVNAIAPGIAAALLATVAGLGVAIPALFGYNWLASRIKQISADTQIFVDEFITRVAEEYGAR